MDNKSTNRNKTLQEMNFEHWVSKIKIIAQAETQLIGLGSGGTNAVKYIWSQWVKGLSTVINDPADADIPEGIKFDSFSLN